MIDEYTLLNAIRSNPDDDTIRLVYADWLEERGEDLRASFIRNHIELERNRCSRCETHAGNLLGLGQPIDFALAAHQHLVSIHSNFAHMPEEQRNLITIGKQVRSDFPDCQKCQERQRVFDNLPMFSTLKDSAVILGVPEHLIVEDFRNATSDDVNSYYFLRFTTMDFCRGLLAKLSLPFDHLLNNLGRMLFARHPISSVSVYSPFIYGTGEITLWDSGTESHSDSYNRLSLPSEIFDNLAGWNAAQSTTNGKHYNTIPEAISELNRAILKWHTMHPITPRECVELYQMNESVFAQFALLRKQYLLQIENDRKAYEEARQRRKEEDEKNAPLRDARVRLGIRCPQCDFRFGWDGSSCEHCKYVTPYSG
jgi:uncharacterized protein (TIGR02996 family)